MKPPDKTKCNIEKLEEQELSSEFTTTEMTSSDGNTYILKTPKKIKHKKVTITVDKKFENLISKLGTVLATPRMMAQIIGMDELTFRKLYKRNEYVRRLIDDSMQKGLFDMKTLAFEKVNKSTNPQYALDLLRSFGELPPENQTINKDGRNVIAGNMDLEQCEDKSKEQKQVLNESRVIERIQDILDRSDKISNIIDIKSKKGHG